MNRKLIQRVYATLGILLITTLVSSAVFAAKAPAKKPAKKTTNKTTSTATNKATKGTTQLKSDYNNPKVGETFTLGKKEPINVTINSIEYTVDQVSIGDSEYIAEANEKLMVIHYTLHNPNNKDYAATWASIKFFCIDASDQNWDYVQNVGIEKSKERCHMSLKPAQKTQLYTVIKVPADGALPKLMLESRDRLVLRYNLQAKENKVKPLPSPIADPADESGATALENVPAEIGVFYPMYNFDVKLDSVAFSDEPIMGKSPKKGHRYLVSIMTLKNSCPTKKGTK